MVAINPFSALSSTVGQSAKDDNSIAQNFQAFLSLLTTQLQNQNPLDPLDTNQFTQQLVQFSEVEQTLKTNENLEKLTSLAAANTITNAVGYIGKQVTADGATAKLENGLASWDYTVDGSSPAATFTVRDANGTTVYSETKSASGAGTFAWNGQRSNGGTAPPGEYTLSINAADGNGGKLDSSVSFSGVVDGVDMSGAEVVVLVGGRRVTLDQITGISLPSSSSS